MRNFDTIKWTFKDHLKLTFEEANKNYNISWYHIFLILYVALVSYNKLPTNKFKIIYTFKKDEMLGVC